MHLCSSLTFHAQALGVSHIVQFKPFPKAKEYKIIFYAYPFIIGRVAQKVTKKTHAGSPKIGVIERVSKEKIP